MVYDVTQASHASLLLRFIKIPHRFFIDHTLVLYIDFLIFPS